MSQPASLKETPLSPRMSTHSDTRQRSETSLSNPPEPKEDVLPPAWKPSVRVYVAFFTLAVITLMVALDGTSLSVALPIIAQKLKGTAIEAFWSGTSFLLCSTIFQPNFASFSHIFGRKPMIMTGLVFFLVGVIVAAVAKDFATLLVGRSIQGIGGGGLIALTEIVVTDLVPLRLRGQWFGIISGMWALGSVSGPVIGGAFAQNVSWRWIFWLNLPFIGVAFVLVPLFLKLNFRPSNLREQLKRVDWVGSVLFIGSTTSFLIPITWGGVMYDWDSWRTLVPLLVGAVGLVTFVLFEKYVASEPLIRLSVFMNRSAAVNYAGTVIHGMILWCLLYYSPLYYEGVKGYTPIIAGISIFPETFTVAPVSVVTGIVVTLTGRYRWSLWAGWFFATLGTGILYLLDVDTSVVSWIFLNLVVGIGMGMLFPAMAFAIQASSKNEDLAFAVAMFSFFRAFGQAIGVAIGGTIFQNEVKKKLLAYPTLASKAIEYSKDSTTLVQIIKALPEGLEKTQLKQGYADALKVVWIVLCGLSAVALILSLWTEGLDLNTPLETEQGISEEKKTVDEEKI
ncbi:hypothetical protein MMC07_002654 [Pseudocyphellaria aurata]|nr:hypothetical protein [Pseudocyphellaria aurata]